MSTIIATILATIIAIGGIAVMNLYAKGYRFIDLSDQFLIEQEDWDYIHDEFSEISDTVEKSGHLNNLAKDRPKVVRRVDRRVGAVEQRIEQAHKKAQERAVT